MLWFQPRLQRPHLTVRLQDARIPPLHRGHGSWPRILFCTTDEGHLQRGAELCPPDSYVEALTSSTTVQRLSEIEVKWFSPGLTGVLIRREPLSHTQRGHQVKTELLQAKDTPQEILVLGHLDLGLAASGSVRKCVSVALASGPWCFGPAAPTH